MKLTIKNDHTGFDYKQSLYEELLSQGHEIKDFNTFNNKSVDYPDFAHPVSSFIKANPGSKDILICESNNNVTIVTNKHTDIRAAIC